MNNLLVLLKTNSKLKKGCSKIGKHLTNHTDWLNADNHGYPSANSADYCTAPAKPTKITLDNTMDIQNRQLPVCNIANINHNNNNFHYNNLHKAHIIKK